MRRASARCLRSGRPQLLPRSSGGRVPALEIFINTFAASRHIINGEIEKLEEVIDQGMALGMQRMDNSICELFLQQVISQDVAMARAISPDRLYQLMTNEVDEQTNSEQQGTTISDDVEVGGQEAIEEADA